MKLGHNITANKFVTKKKSRGNIRLRDTENIQAVIRHLPLRLFLLLALLVLIECVYEFLIGVYFETKLSRMAHCLLNAGIVSAIITPMVWQLISLLKHHQEALEKEVHFQQLEGQLARAFGMAETESDIIKVFKRVVSKIIPETPVELLLADSSMAHLRLATSTVAPVCTELKDITPDPEKRNTEDAADSCTASVPMCKVRSPRDCMATRLGKNHIFVDSLALDACPILVDRNEHSISAVCVPINIAGVTVGVIRSDVTSGDVDLDFIESIFSDIAKHLGNRLGLVRALNSANQAAMTDPLTGLLNRRSLEDRCEAYLAEKRKFAVVVMDIDFFKKLNDTYSHAVGDRSLKIFSKALQKSCRKDDLVARLGGEEFCMVLLNINAETAVQTLKRVKSELPISLAQAGLPEFTVSYGVTDTDFGDNLEALIKIADHAMYEAKKAGRDKIAIASGKSEPKAEQEVIQSVN
jgi:diguanylate cyclase (GGDEF)-like protein